MMNHNILLTDVSELHFYLMIGFVLYSIIQHLSTFIYCECKKCEIYNFLGLIFTGYSINLIQLSFFKSKITFVSFR